MKNFYSFSLIPLIIKMKGVEKKKNFYGTDNKPG